MLKHYSCDDFFHGIHFLMLCSYSKIKRSTNYSVHCIHVQIAFITVCMVERSSTNTIIIIIILFDMDFLQSNGH